MRQWQLVKIERKALVLPLSREVGRIEQLKRSLVAYRSVIGQPRQKELLEFLSSRLSPEQVQEFVDSVSIDLSPPKGWMETRRSCRSAGELRTLPARKEWDR